MNQYLDQRLRPFVNYFQDNWSDLLPSMDFAQAVLPHESTGLPPAIIEFGSLPRCHWNWQARTTQFLDKRDQDIRKEAQELASARKEAVDKASEIVKSNLAAAQARQAKQANKHRREPDFDVGDMVYLSAKGWATDRPSVKLDYQNRGPYRITGRKGYAYILDLPDHIKVDNQFPADRLRKAADNPLPGQIEPPEPPIEVRGEQEWEVEEIVNSKLVRKVLRYQAIWKGYDQDRQWYNASGFVNAPEVVKAYHDRYPEKPGPPIRLKYWLEAKAKGETLDPHDDDCTAEHGRQPKARQRRHQR